MQARSNWCPGDEGRKDLKARMMMQMTKEAKEVERLRKRVKQLECSLEDIGFHVEQVARGGSNVDMDTILDEVMMIVHEELLR